MPLTPVFRARLQASIAAFGGLVLWWRLGGVLPMALAGGFAALAALAWLAPTHYAPVQHAIDRIAKLLLAGLSWLLLGLVYFGVFTPLRAVGMLLRREPLSQQSDPIAQSHLQPVQPAATGRFERQF